jgi:hypothetical protein
MVYCTSARITCSAAYNDLIFLQITEAFPITDQGGEAVIGKIRDISANGRFSNLTGGLK